MTHFLPSITKLNLCRTVHRVEEQKPKEKTILHSIIKAEVKHNDTYRHMYILYKHKLRGKGNTFDFKSTVKNNKWNKRIKARHKQIVVVRTFILSSIISKMRT